MYTDVCRFASRNKFDLYLWYCSTKMNIRTQRESVEIGANARKTNVVYDTVVRKDIASEDHKRGTDASLFFW